MTYSPWGDLSSRIDVDLEWEPALPPEVHGLSAPRRIWLQPGLTRREARVALAHELVHLDRQDAPLDGKDSARLSARQESQVDREMAYRLIPIRALAACVMAGLDLEQTAEELNVEPWVVELRTSHLHMTEKHVLNKAINERGDHL